MFKLFQNKKLIIILCTVLAVLLAVGAGVLVWQLTKRGTYTISFVTNGGNAIESIEVEKGAVLSQAELPIPSKRGELFLTWNTDEALTLPYWDSPIESDMTLYASYVEPTGDVTTNELVESVIPFADADFSVTLCSPVELTNDNIGQYIMLTVSYGHHENGDEIKLSVAKESEGIYRISGNYAAGGEYILSLISNDITFNPNDTLLTAYGLTDALRTLRFRIIGETYMNGELSDKVADIPSEAITFVDADSVKISDISSGAPEALNHIICVGDGDDISDYYKIVGVESVSSDSIVCTVTPAAADEVYDSAVGYQWENLDGDDYIIDEELLAQAMAEIESNEQLNNYVKYLALSATETSTYQAMSTDMFGEVVAMPMTTVVSPSGITWGVDKNAYNKHFVDVIGENNAKKFVKLTLGIQYEVKLAKLGSKGTITAEVGLQVDFWFYFGMGGRFELGWGEYDIDYGASLMTQTEITFTISLITSDAKKAVNINDEIEAIYNSVKEPTPENLLEQYNELMSGGSKPIELFNKNIFKVPVLSMLGGLVEISVPIRFVLSLDVEATFSSYVTVLTGNAFGLEGNEDTGLDAYHDDIPERYTYRLELRGHIELRAGAELGIELSLGFGLATVSLNVQAGLYAELYGYFFYEIERMSLYGGTTSKNMGGAYYFEFGLYVDIRVRAEVCKIKYSGSLWDKKWPFFTAGQKEIVYGFVNPTSDVITLGNGLVYVDDSELLNVYVYDITEERDENNPRVVKNYPFSERNFSFSFSNDTFAIGNISEDGGKTFDYAIVCWGSGIDYFNGGGAVEAILTINYKGAQLAFRDTLTKYVTVRYTPMANSDVNWDKVGDVCRVKFNVDGKTIFYRDVLYGSILTDQPDIAHSVGSDGKVVFSDLRQSEQEAMDKAGITYAEWEINKGSAFFVTEDVTFEANVKNLKRRKLKVTLVNGSESDISEHYYGDEITLTLPDNANITTTREVYQFAGWRTGNGMVYSAGNVYTVMGDVTFSSQYKSTPRRYTVTFDGGGGKVGNDSATYEMVVNYGTVPEYPFTPTREATETARYEFIGWSPKLSKVTGDVTYTAQWREIKRYTVIFDAGEGQFDEDGTKTISFTIDEGDSMSSGDCPIEPYKKATGGYYELDTWSGAVFNGNVVYTASYKNELIRKTGITISDGTSSEDIAAYLDGTNKVSGYSYTLNTEDSGNVLEIKSPGLTLSGKAEDINLTVVNTEVTLRDLTLVQNARVAVITAQGAATLNFSGNVELTANTDAEAIRGDYSGEYDPVNGVWSDLADADITLRGVNEQSKLIINGQAYGIAVYGALTVDKLDVEINMPDIPDNTGSEYAYHMVALQVHNHPKGVLTVTNSDIIVNGGLVNVAWLKMTDSNLTLTAEKFVANSYASGLYIMNYSELVDREALIVLTNSHISFAHDIAIAIAASVNDGSLDSILDDTLYLVNVGINNEGVVSTYSSLEAFFADVNTNGYVGMVMIDGKSSIT